MTHDSNKEAEALMLEAQTNLALEKSRPFNLIGGQCFQYGIDGNQCYVLLGENLQEGVAGFGDSYEEASRDFDVNWKKKLQR